MVREPEASASPVDHGSGTIGIITISKDDPAGLERTLVSIARQSAVPMEVAVVCTGLSRDAHQRLDVGLHTRGIADPGRGIAAAFNAGVDACTADWLVFLNGGDTFADRNSLALLGAACAAASSADIVTCRARTGIRSTLPRHRPRRLCDFLYVSHQATAFRRSLFALTGPYSEDFLIRMDLDWMARYLLRYGHERILCDDRIVVDYQVDGISSTSVVDFHAEEIRVLCRSARFIPALADFMIRRLPGRLARSALTALRSPRTLRS
jgi:glycosyltransferase involved in cell wall biosynthesis